MLHIIDNSRIDISIQGLRQYIAAEDAEPLIVILETLKTAENSTVGIKQLADTLNQMGITQGAVLTYAPYISVLISDDPFSD
jgi:hypothetical protein